jgi:hypothetical protein
MAWKEMNEQPVKDELETAAGIVRLRPYMREVIKPSGDELRAFHVFLEAPGSPEKRTGYVSFRYKKVGDMGEGDAYRALRANKLDDGDKIAEIRSFYPFRFVPESEKKALMGNGIGYAVMSAA